MKNDNLKFKIIFFCLIFLSGFLMWENAQAADYYVDFDSGNDTNSGISSNLPWKHAPGDPSATNIPASKGSSSDPLQPGDSILFKGGVVYRGKINIDGRWINGAQDNPITLKGDGWGAGKAIIDGSTVLPNNFIPCSSAVDCGDNPNWQNIFYQDFSGQNYTYNQGFYEDDNFLWYAQDPNPLDSIAYDNLANLRTIEYPRTSVDYTRTSITDPRYFSQSDQDFWVGAYVIAWYTPNLVRPNIITSFNPETDTVYHEDTGGTSPSGDTYTDRAAYYSVINHVSLIDVPGEFSFNEAAQRLYVWPREGIINHDYSVRTLGAAITDYNGAKNLVIDGFILQKFIMGIDTQNSPLPENITVKNNEIKNLKSNNESALHMSGNNVVIDNNYVHDNERAIGILFGGTGGVVSNNIVDRTTRQGIWFMGAQDSQAINNTISNICGAHANGLSVYSDSSNIIIANNKISEVDSPLTFEQSSNLTFYNNIISGNGESNVSEWGGNTGTIAFYNNIAVNNTRNWAFGIGQNAGATYIMKNNIIDGGDCSAQVQCDRTNNIYTGLAWSQDENYGWNLGSDDVLETDLTKIFVDSVNNNFHLKFDGPAINTGASLPGIVDYDIEGNSRPAGSIWDIGAYEYIGAADVIAPASPTGLSVS